MHGFSAHADRDDLLAALRPLAGGAQRLFLVHGEDAARASLRADLEASGYRQIDEPMPQQNYSIHS